MECPYIRQANSMCNVLVNEVAQANTWARTQDAIWAIQRVQSKAKSHIVEWEHLNNPSPGLECCASDPTRMLFEFAEQYGYLVDRLGNKIKVKV